MCTPQVVTKQFKMQRGVNVQRSEHALPSLVLKDCAWRTEVSVWSSQTQSTNHWRVSKAPWCFCRCPKPQLFWWTNQCHLTALLYKVNIMHGRGLRVADNDVSVGHPPPCRQEVESIVSLMKQCLLNRRCYIHGNKGKRKTLSAGALNRTVVSLARFACISMYFHVWADGRIMVRRM